ncbi:fungal protease inhibitor-1-like [Agrilus planipennis]|uniref:Fungal protease inhibitor-1-like n=1 Tax=Agrilus planipennis TaxID=224129 RepID=A0A1W4WP31_AGRPL|nr:fungal protease inhibitor-1-like [Agrilus planipennis]
MNYLFVLLISVGIVYAAVNIVCPTDYCTQHNCKNETDCGPGKTPGKTFCGCCSQCVTVIDKGGLCTVMRGVPPKSVCMKGTSCINGTCQ